MAFLNLDFAAAHEVEGAPATPGIAVPALDLSAIIVVETQDLLFLNKPRGVLTHGPGGLDEAVLAYLSYKKDDSLSFVPAPLHRLDRNTTGLVVASKTLKGARAFSSALSDHEISKHYLAVLRGRLDRPDRWVDSLERLSRDRRTVRSSDAAHRKAITLVEPITANGSFTLADIRILTGFTHQIRAQAAMRGRPLAGDSKYGGGSEGIGYILHAYRLDFPPDFQADAPETVFAPVSDEVAANLRDRFGPRIILAAPPGVILP